jgi:site-specific DNA recombinase
VLLADTFGQADVALHSFTEKLDLSSATGRMFYNILGSFAQFYREQLGENVRLGLQQAVKQGKWPNRPKLGYSRLDGTLVPNDDASVVRRIFKLRAEGSSYRAIEQDTGVSFSTVHGILRSRIYLGETLYRDEWFPGEHEPILTETEWQAAHRGHVPGRRRGKQLNRPGNGGHSSP